MWQGVDHLKIGMAVCSSRNEVLIADRAYSAILGRENAGGLGLTMADVTHPDDRACNDRLLAMLRATRAPFRITKRYLIGDRPVWVENRVSWLGGEREEARIAVLCRPLDPAEVDRAPLTPEQAAEAAATADYVRDFTGQLAAMSDHARLPFTAAVLRLARALMAEEHEMLALPGGDDRPIKD